MAPSDTLPHPPVIRQLPRHGTLRLFGFGVRVSVWNGNLSCHDGIGLERRSFLLSKVNSNLKRLVMIGSDGTISLEALRWITDREASFYMLDRRGKVLTVCGPSAPSDSKLRRSQSLALQNGTALRISRELIRQKLEGQATLPRDMLHSTAIARAIHKFRDELPTADSIESVRIIEAQAAKLYWSAWAEVPIRWARKDERRVPPHWKRFGSRISPLTHSPRVAVSPGSALINVLYSILEAEARIACVAMGLDPAIGLLHVDAPNRDSLVFDILEPIRPKCDAFVLHWLQSEPFRKADFWEDRNGNCRLSSALAIKLCETADTWRKLVAPVAEYCAQELWNSRGSKSERMLLATRLTQRNKRIVKGREVPSVKHPRPEHVCGDCGARISAGRKICLECWQKATPANLATGRRMAQTPDSRARRTDTQRKQVALNRAFDIASLPAWLTREFYLSRIVPALANLARANIKGVLGVSEPHAARIQKGIVPHPRHWRTLAQLGEVSQDVEV